MSEDVEITNQSVKLLERAQCKLNPDKRWEEYSIAMYWTNRAIGHLQRKLWFSIREPQESP